MSSETTFELPRTYDRFSVSDRVQHAVMVVSFLVLTVTGLPQKFIYLNNRYLDDLIDLMGGIEGVRVVHRWAATVLMLATVYHLLAAAHRVLVRRVSLSMLPRYQDVVDALQAVRYNLGLAKERPRTDRYTWEEKVEYWSLLWGTIVMIATGFMLWNPIATARFLPGEFIPAAQVVHGGEAILAILAVLVWHFYSVHLRSFNRAMFTGQLTEHEMEHEHPLELARIKAGAAHAGPRPGRPRAAAEGLPAGGRRDRRAAPRRDLLVRDLRADGDHDAALCIVRRVSVILRRFGRGGRRRIRNLSAGGTADSSSPGETKLLGMTGPGQTAFQPGGIRPPGAPRSRSSAVREQHRVDDPEHDERADGEGGPGEGPDRPDHHRLVGLDQVLLELPRRHQRLVLRRLVALELRHRHPPGEHDRVHRELLGPQVGVEEVHREDEAGGEQRLVAVDDGRDVDEPARAGAA